MRLIKVMRRLPASTTHTALLDLMCLLLPVVQGSAFYLAGAVLVIIGWTVIGLGLEAYGFWLLFCEFIPTVLQFSRRVPFLSQVLDMPFLKVVGGVQRAGCATALNNVLLTAWSSAAGALRGTQLP